MAKSSAREFRVHSSLSKGELKELDQVVVQDASTRSAVIRIAIVEYLRRRLHKPSDGQRK